VIARAASALRPVHLDLDLVPVPVRVPVIAKKARSILAAGVLPKKNAVVDFVVSLYHRTHLFCRDSQSQCFFLIQFCRVLRKIGEE
jgi:hypothetical protein